MSQPPHNGGQGGAGVHLESGRLLRQMMDAVETGIMLLSPDLRVQDANQWLLRRFGGPPDWRGLHCWEIMGQADAPCPSCPVREAKEQGRRFVADLPFTSSDGQAMWLEVVVHPFFGPDGRLQSLIVSHRDITQARLARLEEERRAHELKCAFDDLQALKVILQTSRDKFKAVFDAIVEPIYSITPEGLVESVNAAAAKLTGLHPRELVGRPCGEVLGMARPPLPAAQCCREGLEEAVRSGRGQDRLVEMPGEDGPRYFNLMHTPVTGADGRVSLVIVQIKDVTRFKRMEATIREYSQRLEEKVAERTRELIQANRELKRVDQLRRDLFNMVVHDMKSPLAELMGNLDMLTYGDLDGDQLQLLDMGLMGAEDLLRMIMNLLDIERMEEDQLPVRQEELDFTELAEKVRSRFRTMISLKELKVEVRDHLAGGLYADRELMGRVLQNLLTNALHYTDSGGSITMAAAPGQAGGALISVADTGAGIPAEKRSRIFNKFTQADDDGGPRTSTGLGLTFCKLTVEGHGGRIWLESAVGRGTTFYVWLPPLPSESPSEDSSGPLPGELAWP